MIILYKFWNNTAFSTLNYNVLYLIIRSMDQIVLAVQVPMHSPLYMYFKFSSLFAAPYQPFLCFSMQKVDKMYVAFTGQSLETVQQYTERDRFLSVSEVMMLNSSC